MFDDYKNAILQHFDEVLSGSMESSPNYKTMIMIQNALIARGMTRELAERSVTSMQVVVASELFEDQAFIHQVVESYAEVIHRIHQFAVNNFTTPEAFQNLIDGMSLTLVPPQ